MTAQSFLNHIHIYKKRYIIGVIILVIVSIAATFGVLYTQQRDAVARAIKNNNTIYQNYSGKSIELLQKIKESNSDQPAEVNEEYLHNSLNSIQGYITDIKNINETYEQNNDNLIQGNNQDTETLYKSYQSSFQSTKTFLTETSDYLELNSCLIAKNITYIDLANSINKNKQAIGQTTDSKEIVRLIDLVISDVDKSKDNNTQVLTCFSNSLEKYQTSEFSEKVNSLNIWYSQYASVLTDLKKGVVEGKLDVANKANDDLNNLAKTEDSVQIWSNDNIDKLLTNAEAKIQPVWDDLIKKEVELNSLKKEISSKYLLPN